MLYGRKHPTHVRTIVEGAMKIDPSHTTALRQAWVYTTNSLVRSANVVQVESEKSSPPNSTAGIAATRKKMRDVLQFVLDMLDTTVSVVDTCPTVFRDTCEEPAGMLR